MIRKLLISTVLATMVTPANATDADVLAVMEVEAFNIAILYNYCTNYSTPKKEVGTIVTHFIADLKGLTFDQSAALLDNTSQRIWARVPTSEEHQVCLSGMKAEANWLLAMERK